MAKHIVKDPSGTTYTIPGSGTWLFQKSAHIATQDIGIQAASLDDVAVVIEGKVSGDFLDGQAIHSAGANFSLLIEKGAQAKGYDAVSVEGDNARVVNRGTIEGRSSVIDSTGDAAKLFNYGKIHAGLTRLDDGSAVEIEGDGSVFRNSGRIGSEYLGFHITGNDCTVINGKSGRITAEREAIVINDPPPDARMEAAAVGQTFTLINHGTIKSDWAVTAAYQARQIVINYGMIDGQLWTAPHSDYDDVIKNLGGTITWFFATHEGDDTVVNTGLMKSVFLGDGADTLDNRGGTIISFVDGEAGDDIIDTRDGKMNGEVLGGEGDDTFIVSNARLTMGELAGGGDLDTVKSTVSYTLTAEIEALRLIGGRNINATGTADSEAIYGNSGDNIIKGNGGGDRMEGGKGNDELTGGANDADSFWFSTGDGKDIITNFTLENLDGHDVIALAGWEAIENYLDLTENHVKESHGDLIIFAGKDSITLRGISAEQLASGYFDFAA